jgi:arginyl-tRNA synthetase
VPLIVLLVVLWKIERGSQEENEQVRNLRLVLAETIAKIIRSGMKLLGIGVVDRM